MTFVPASSEYVSNNIARRTVRDAQQLAEEETAKNFIQPFLAPIVMRLAKAGRLQRDVLPKLVTKLDADLSASEMVFGLESAIFRKSKLSSNEAYRIVFKAPSSQDEEWMAFTATEVNMTRRSVRLTYCYSDVYIHRHAISRFIQREESPPEGIYKFLAAAIDLATVMAWPILQHKRKDRNIAVPLGNGMLFGRINASKGGYQRGIMNFDGRSVTQEEELRQPGFDYMMEIEFMTYVDFNSLSPHREALRERIVEFATEHAMGIKLAADSTYYQRLALPEGYSREDLQGMINDCKPGVDKLLDSAEWFHFTNTVGR